MRDLRLTANKIFRNTFTLLGLSCFILLVYSTNHLRKLAYRPLSFVRINYPA